MVKIEKEGKFVVRVRVDRSHATTSSSNEDGEVGVGWLHNNSFTFAFRSAIQLMIQLRQCICTFSINT